MSVVENFKLHDWHLHYTLVLSQEERQYIVECVNACAGQSIEDVKLATEHKNACMEWERLMVELVGEDGTKSVREAIELLKGQKEAAWAELKSIREHIGADDNESTYDEVVRLTVNRNTIAI